MALISVHPDVLAVHVLRPGASVGSVRAACAACSLTGGASTCTAWSLKGNRSAGTWAWACFVGAAATSACTPFSLGWRRSAGAWASLSLGRNSPSGTCTCTLRGGYTSAGTWACSSLGGSREAGTWMPTSSGTCTASSAADGLGHTAQTGAFLPPPSSFSSHLRCGRSDSSTAANSATDSCGAGHREGWLSKITDSVWVHAMDGQFLPTP